MASRSACHSACTEEFNVEREWCDLASISAWLLRSDLCDNCDYQCFVYGIRTVLISVDFYGTRDVDC
jgi:hypothetical protein